MDVTNDATISRTARKLAGAVEALVRSLAARRPYMPRDGLETESLLLTPWIQINRPDLAQSYCDYLYWISVEARRLYRQRSSELPSENWLTQHLFFTEQCFKFTILLRQLAVHIDGRSGELGPDALKRAEERWLTIQGDFEGYVPADTLSIDHDINRSRLSEAATAGKVDTKSAPKGLRDSSGRRVLKLYNKEQAIKHFSVKKKAPK